MQKLYQNESPIVIFGGREKAYHFSYVDDVATNLIELSKQLLEKRFQDVLMIAGEWATLWEVAEHALRTVQDHHVELIERPHRTGEIMRCRLDLTRMQGMGLRMPTTVKDGVERAAAWYRDHERYKFVGIHG
jgi:nucleoside-diphosphate-sugar epimerase